MQGEATKKFDYTWEQAIEILRNDPQHQKLIFDSYLTADFEGNCQRFYASTEFTEVLRLINELLPGAQKVLDVPAGNGIASFAFAKSGFKVTAIEPDPSASVGRGAIEYIRQKEDCWRTSRFSMRMARIFPVRMKHLTLPMSGKDCIMRTTCAKWFLKLSESQDPGV
jgi:hypothetical protein